MAGGTCCNMKCWDGLWKAPPSPPSDESHPMLTAVCMQLCWPPPCSKGVPTAQVPAAAQDQLGRTLGENHFSSKRKIKVSVQDDTRENS